MNNSFRICGRWIAATALMFAVLLGSAQAWDCAWPYRIPIQVANGPTAYADEIRIDLVSANFPASYVFSAAGADVRVFAADDTTAVSHFVTSWNATARSATIYIRPATLAANSTTTFYIYVGNTAVASGGSVAAVFPNTGMRLQSRSTTSDPTSVATARTAFNAATSTYDATRTNITGLTNTAIGGANNNFAWCVGALVEVTAANAGTWTFRFGGDIGRGGHLLMRDTMLEEQWNDNLWWGGTYADPSETLEGSISLAAGWHRYEAFGFEDCCDGAVGSQGRRPTGPYLDFNTTNFTLRSARCTAPGVTVTPQAHQSCPSTLLTSKSVSILSDPLGSASPFALPGSVVRYQIQVENPGPQIDANTINLVDVLPSQVSLIVSGATAFEFIDGPPASALGFVWGGPASTTDSVEFSTNGVTFTYIPTPSGPNNVDPAVTHVRFRPSGALAPFTPAGGRPQFNVRFSVVVE